MQVIGEATIRVTSDMRGLRRSLQRSVDEAFRGLRVPNQNALTDFQRRLRDGEDDLTASSDRRRTSLLAQLAALDRATGAQDSYTAALDRSRRVTIDVDRDHDRLAGSLRRVSGVAGSAASGLGKVALQGAKLSLIGAAGVAAAGGLAAITGQALSLVAALGQAAPAAGLLPAAFAGYLAVAGTVRLATQGMGDAFKAVGEGDAEALKEAMEGLAPSARAFVTEIDRARPAFERMQLTVQQRAFAGLSDEVRALSERYLPQGTALFQGMAATLNGMAGDVARFALSGRAFADVQVIVAQLQMAFGNLRGAIAPIAAAILDVVSVGSTFLPELTASLTSTITRWSERVSAMAASGELAAYFRNALDVLSQLGRVLGNIGSTIGGVFRAADAASGGFLDTLERITASMSEFVNSAEGQATIQALFDRLQSSVQAMMPVLGALLDLAMELSPVFAEIAEAVGPILADAITTLSPHIVKLAEFFADLLDAATPLIDALVQLVSDVLSALEPIMPDIVEAFGQLAQVFADLLGNEAVVSIFSSLAELLAPLVELFAQLLRILGPVLDLLAFFVDIVATVIGGVVDLATTMVGGLADALSGSNQDMVEWAHEAIGLGDRVGSVLTAAGIGVKSLFEQVNEAVALHVIELNGGVTAVGGALTRTVRDFNLYGSGASGALTRVGGSARHQLQVMADWRNKMRLYAMATADAFNIMAGRTASAMGRAGSAVSAFGDIARRSLGSAGAGAFASGARIGDGLAAGIRSRIGTVAAAALALAGAAGSALPRSPAKIGPFSGTGWTPYRGRAIAEGLAEGIRDATPQMTATALASMRLLSDTMNSELARLRALDLSATGSLDLTADNGLRQALDTTVLPVGDDGARTMTPEEMAEAVAAGMTRVAVVLSDREVAHGVRRVDQMDKRR